MCSSVCNTTLVMNNRFTWHPAQDLCKLCLYYALSISEVHMGRGCLCKSRNNFSASPSTLYSHHTMVTIWRNFCALGRSLKCSVGCPWSLGRCHYIKKAGVIDITILTHEYFMSEEHVQQDTALSCKEEAYMNRDIWTYKNMFGNHEHHII